MTTKIRVRDIDYSAYHDFLEEAEGKTLFHSLEWLTAIHQGFGVGARLIGFSDGHELIAVCPVEYKGPHVFRIAGSPIPGVFTPYQGIVWKRGAEMGLKDDTISALISHTNSPYFRLDWPPGVNGLNAVTAVQTCQTPLLDLSVGADAIFKAMDGKTRNQIRQAFRRGVHVDFYWHGGDWYNSYMRLSRATYERQGLSSPMRLQFLKELFRMNCSRHEAGSHSQRGLARPGENAFHDFWGTGVAVAQVNKETIAASLIVFDSSTVYYLDNVSLREKQQYRPNNAIIWKIIKWATENGFKTFDLVGANVPSIASFKLGFGAELRQYPVITKYSRLGRAAYEVRRLIRGVRQGMFRR